MDYLAPVTEVIDKTEELLGHSPIRRSSRCRSHWAVSNICDGLALATGDDRYDDAARLSMGIGLIGAAAAVATGLRDYSFIPPDRPSHGVATAHGLGNALADHSSWPAMCSAIGTVRRAGARACSPACSR